MLLNVGDEAAVPFDHVLKVLVRGEGVAGAGAGVGLVAVEGGRDGVDVALADGEDVALGVFRGLLEGLLVLDGFLVSSLLGLRGGLVLILVVGGCGEAGFRFTTFI